MTQGNLIITVLIGWQKDIVTAGNCRVCKIGLIGPRRFKGHREYQTEGLAAKGPKYRETNRVTGELQKECLLNLLIPLQKNWSKRKQAELKDLSEWKNQLKELVCRACFKFEKAFQIA